MQRGSSVKQSKKLKKVRAQSSLHNSVDTVQNPYYCRYFLFDKLCHFPKVAALMHLLERNYNFLVKAKKLFSQK